MKLLPKLSNLNNFDLKFSILKIHANTILNTYLLKEAKNGHFMKVVQLMIVRKHLE